MLELPAMHDADSEFDSRSRSVRWRDPGLPASAARTVSGIEFMQAALDGVYEAPICPLLGFHLTAVGDGSVTFELEPHESQYNLIGVVHGGVIATLLDSSMGCAVHTKLPAGDSYATLEINVNYSRAVTKDVGPLRCEGHVVTLGSRVATARGSITDREDRLYAHATTVCLVVRGGPR
jgi:uncharacterized protein (TIGR00369 family)